MEIQKLKKKLLREELKRRRKNSKLYRWLVPGVLLSLILVFVGLIYYMINFDQMLEEQYAKGEILMEQGEYEDAVQVFRLLYKEHPRFYLAPKALYQTGDVLNLYLKRHHEALLAYLLVEKDYPESEMARKAQVQVAEIYKNRLRDYSRAIVAYQKLLDAGVDEGDRIQYEVADCYFRLNNFEQARIEFESLLKSHPDTPLTPEVLYRIGVTWSLEGSLREAEEAFRRVIDAWPDNPYAAEAGFGLAAVFEEREELKAALQILEGLEGFYPNGEALSKKIEQVKERIKKKKKAI